MICQSGKTTDRKGINGMESEVVFPTGFWAALLVLVGLCWEAAARLNRPWSKPLLVSYGTVGAWYHLDYVYNDPASFAKDFSDEVLNESFAEVSWFLICLRLFTGIFANVFLSGVRLPPPTPLATANRQEYRFFALLAVTWVALAAFAMLHTEGDVMSLVCPPLSSYGFPWSRAGVGGAWDFLLSTANYVHLAVCGMSGVLVSIARSPRLRLLALMLWVQSSPIFVFGRARNMILAILLPGLLAYVLVGRSTGFKKVVVSLGLFAAVMTWFAIVLSTRDNNFSFLQADSDLSVLDSSSTHHHGLDMLHELCYINTFLVNGKYEVNWGRRYFAEVAAFVPRGLWPGKPMIGIDYAVARGFGGTGSDHGVFATIATGMIGQGVVNFGTFLGPMAAAALVAAWVCVLSRLWIQRRDINRLLLCLLGMGLTFNMGRDITLLVLFPFVFSYIGIRAYERFFVSSAPVPSHRVVRPA